MREKILVGMILTGALVGCSPGHRTGSNSESIENVSHQDLFSDRPIAPVRS